MLSQGGKKGQENIKKKNKTSWESVIVADLYFFFTWII